MSINISAEKIRYIGRTSSNYAIGDFYSLYANGQPVVVANNTSSLTTAKSKGCTPIASIFYKGNLTTSDKNRGWTMGYGIYIYYASTDTKWSTNTSRTVQATVYSQANYKSACSDYDGYGETTRITGSSSYNSTTYPAFFIARNFGSTIALPSQTSGWFLPSMGQCFLAKVNLFGGYSDTNKLYQHVETNYRNGWRDGSNGVASGFCDNTYRVKQNNHWAYLKAVFPDLEVSPEVYTWTSTESDAQYALETEGYDSDGPYICVQRFEPKTSGRPVKPALAF